MIIAKRFTFEASHILPLHPGKCSQLHGHSWGLRVSVKGPIDAHTGMVMDYTFLGNLVHEHIIEHLDHTHLGCYAAFAGVPEGEMGKLQKPYFGYTFYPTSEHLAKRIFEILLPLIDKENPNVRLHEITIEETCTSAATYRWRDYNADHFPTHPYPLAADRGRERGTCPHCGGSGKA